MALWKCLRCTAAYAVGAPKCPQCDSTEYEEDGVAKTSVPGGPTSASAAPGETGYMPPPEPETEAAPETESIPEPEPEPEVPTPAVPAAAPAKASTPRKSSPASSAPAEVTGEGGVTLPPVEAGDSGN